ncbi:MAG TPA: Xaa-Pro peptidase family protein [Dysgonamonadaceae bacterium]|nr:Xaa-Pro peptidase family protein [Dysgonamonadaceae bacterium]HRS41499.1 Xaa-Pro peptidase family protein [Dysgonamonadaceae bacterium]
MEQELRKRIDKVRDFVHEVGGDACIITSQINLFYLNGFIFDGFMYILPERDPLLFVKRPVDILGENVFYISKPEQIPDKLIELGYKIPDKLLIESDSISMSEGNRLQATLGMPQLLNVSGKMKEIRSIKSESEIEQMRTSARIQSKIYEQIPHLYRKGMRDIDFQIEVEYLMRKHGSLGIFRSFGRNMDIFMGSVIAGDNATVPSPYDFAMGGKGLSPYIPIGASGITLAEGMTIMFDMAGNFTPYQSDMTRTFAIGNVPEIAYKAHQISIEMNQWVEENVKSGTPCSEIYNKSIDFVQKNRLKEYFMGTMQQAKFVGHGVGLEINELPVLSSGSKDIMQPNIAFAYEPKFVLPGIGAVGIENTFVIKEAGNEKLTFLDETLRKL